MSIQSGAIAKKDAPVPATQDDALVWAEWNRAATTAIEIEGYSLYGGKENDKKLDTLVDVPFMIRHVTFRVGDITPKGADGPRDFVSCEILIRPDYQDRFPRKGVVFNDGSTGIYRQVLAACVARDLVEVDDNAPAAGPANSTRFDAAVTDGEESSSVTFSDINIVCPEGLRVSDYDNEDGSDARTWYIA